MTSIPAPIWRIYGNKFKRHYLLNKRIFSEFFIAFLKCAWNLDDKYSSIKNLRQQIQPLKKMSILA